jgi:hypothetical protein
VKTFPRRTSDRIGAELFFRAVLPALETWARFDPRAPALLPRAPLRATFTTSDPGPSAVLVADPKGIQVGAHGEGPAHLRIHLGPEAAVAGMVGGRRPTARLGGGFSHPLRLVRLARIFRRFQQLLEPPARLREDPSTRLLHVRLALQVALSSLVVLSREDPTLRPVLGAVKDGVVFFATGDAPLHAALRKEGTHLDRVEGEAAPTTTVRFASTRAAMRILTQRFDPTVALAQGEVEVRGYVPLADAIGHVLDRVADYLPPPR